MTETNIIPASTPPLLTAEERAQAEALADRALSGDLEALNTFEAEIPQARHYLIEVCGNLARDTRRQIIESYLSPEDAVRKRGINLAADELRSTLDNDTGDPLERLQLDRGPPRRANDQPTTRRRQSLVRPGRILSEVSGS